MEVFSLSYRIKHSTDPVQNVQLGLTVDKGVDPGGVDIGVSENIREADDVLFLLIIGHGKEVPEVMREDLLPGDSRQGTECLHPVEDIGAVKGSACAGNEDASLRDGSLPAVGEKFFTELPGEQDHAALSLERNSGAAGMEGGDCDEGQLADPDPGSGQSLHDECQLAAALFSPPLSAGGSLQDPLVFLQRQVFLRTAEGVALDLEGRDAAIMPAHVFKKRIDRRNHGIGSRKLIVVPEILLVLPHSLLIEKGLSPYRLSLYTFCDIHSILTICGFEPGSEMCKVSEVLPDR